MADSHLYSPSIRLVCVEKSKEEFAIRSGASEVTKNKPHP